MKLALKDDTRSEATPKSKASCLCCGGEVIAKCGPKKVWHWSHTSKRTCDHWWENETPWHRDWKNKFPHNCQEIIHYASDGERHIADVKTVEGLVIEFQHSPISQSERLAREQFYKRMVWVVDGQRSDKDYEIFNAGFRTSRWQKWKPNQTIGGIFGRYLPTAWLNSTVPVLFDWGWVKSEYWIEKVESNLVCLLPGCDFHDRHRCVVVRRNDLVDFATSQFSTSAKVQDT